MAVYYDYLVVFGGGRRKGRGEVLGELVQEFAFRAVPVETDAETLGELKRPLGKRGGVVRLEDLDLFFVRVFLKARFVAEEGEVLFMREQVERGECIVGGLVGSGLVLVEVLLVLWEVCRGCG